MGFNKPLTVKVKCSTMWGLGQGQEKKFTFVDILDDGASELGRLILRWHNCFRLSTLFALGCK